MGLVMQRRARKTKKAPELDVDVTGRLVCAPYSGQAVLTAPRAGAVSTALGARPGSQVAAYRSLDAQSVTVTGADGQSTTHHHLAGEGYETEISDVMNRVGPAGRRLRRPRAPGVVPRELVET